jgi:DNA-binding transcriptional ArsR family regulator
MGRTSPSTEVLGMVAERFKALSEPARLQLLHAMQARELSVNELVDETGLGQANVSKHLQVLHALGFVKRRKEGLFVFYTLADRSVLRLCDLMCVRIEAQIEAQKRLLGV